MVAGVLSCSLRAWGTRQDSARRARAADNSLDTHVGGGVFSWAPDGGESIHRCGVRRDPRGQALNRQEGYDVSKERRGSVG